MRGRRQWRPSLFSSSLAPLLGGNTGVSAKLCPLIPLDHWYHNYCPYLDICPVGREAVRYQREHKTKLPDEVLAKIIRERIVRKRRREKAGGKREERSLVELAEGAGMGIVVSPYVKLLETKKKRVLIQKRKNFGHCSVLVLDTSSP